MRLQSTRPGAEIWLDDLDLRDAVIGDGLLLLRGRGLTLYTVARGRARLMGTFDGPLAAWAELDALGG